MYSFSSHLKTTETYHLIKKIAILGKIKNILRKASVITSYQKLHEFQNPALLDYNLNWVNFRENGLASENKDYEKKNVKKRIQMLKNL